MEVMDQRRNEIVEFVNENQTITFTQLKEKFPSVSEMTLRTDLKELFEFMGEPNLWMWFLEMMMY